LNEPGRRGAPGTRGIAPRHTSVCRGRRRRRRPAVVHHRSLPFSVGDTRPDAPAGFLAVAAA
jgi:hypothetical protein